MIIPPSPSPLPRPIIFFPEKKSFICECPFISLITLLRSVGLVDTGHWEGRLGQAQG